MNNTYIHITHVQMIASRMVFHIEDECHYRITFTISPNSIFFGYASLIKNSILEQYDQNKI